MNGLELIVPGPLVPSCGATANLKPGTSTVEFAKLQVGKTVVIRGVFSPAYDNYLLLFSKLHGTGSLRFRLKSSTDAGDSSEYVYQRLTADGGSRPTGARGNPEQDGQLFNVSSDFNGANYPIRSGAHVYVYGPNLGQATAWRSVTTVSNSSGEVRIMDYAGTRNSTKQSTDLELILKEASPREMAGQLTIYGFTKGGITK